MKKIDVKEIKKDFPIFETNPSLVYLDSAASSQTAVPVLNTMEEYYTYFRSNVHRGLYQISQAATVKYENARETVAEFIGAKEKEIIFTGGATLSINLLIYSLEQSFNFKKGDRVVTSVMEHHSNLIPLQELAKRRKLDIVYIDVKDDFTFDYEQAEKLINKDTKIISLTLASNVLGTINDIKKISSLAHKMGALLIVDATKAVGHMELNVKDLDCDFLFFSGHKMCGPTGIGVLYGKEEILEKLNPGFFGGGIVYQVTREGAKWGAIPGRFEAGTPNIAGAIGLAAACDYLTNIGLKEVHEHTLELLDYALLEMRKIDDLETFWKGDSDKNIGVLSFIVEGIHPHDMAEIASRDNVAIRAGHHCSALLMESLKVPATNRVSFYVYNSKEDVDIFIETIKKAKKIFKI